MSSVKSGPQLLDGLKAASNQPPLNVNFPTSLDSDDDDESWADSAEPTSPTPPPEEPKPQLSLIKTPAKPRSVPHSRTTSRVPEEDLDEIAVRQTLEKLKIFQEDSKYDIKFGLMYILKVKTQYKDLTVVF